jgi:hypothetical protein
MEMESVRVWTVPTVTENCAHSFRHRQRRCEYNLPMDGRKESRLKLP